MTFLLPSVKRYLFLEGSLLRYYAGESLLNEKSNISSYLLPQIRKIIITMEHFKLTQK